MYNIYIKNICSQKDRECALPVITIRQWLHDNSCTWAHDVRHEHSVP